MENTVAAVWKYIAMTEGGVIALIVSWWIGKERPRLAALFKANEERYLALLEKYNDLVGKQSKVLAKMTAHLKDLYDRIGVAFKIHEDLKTHTEVDFDAEKDTD